MKKISNFEEARDVLSTFVPATGHNAYKLDNMRDLLAYLDNPQEKYRVIHVAGTSGKTSTCYYIAALLGETGKKIGLTVSPHVDEVNERLQINLTPQNELEYCQNLTAFLSLVEDSPVKPTYFELLIAFAFWEFANQAVDYAVVEVGMGGLLDGTNTVKRQDKICVVTDIGLDHTSVLGKTLPKIAAQKAGIIQENNHVFCLQQSDEMMRAILDRSSSKHAKLHIVESEYDNLSTSGLPLFQKRNWHLAKAVFDFVASRDQLKKLSQEELARSAKTYVPARMEAVRSHGRTIIMDGSHNPQKVEALVKSIEAKYEGETMTVVMGLLTDKELGGVINELKPISDLIIATHFDAEQDMPRSAIKEKEIVKEAERQGIKAVAIASPSEAYESALKSGKPVLIVGSFFLLNNIRPLILRR